MMNKIKNKITKYFNSLNVGRFLCKIGIQKNPNQSRWTDSPKAHGDIIIDDTALGCPLKTDFELSNTPFVDWEKVDKMLFI